MKTNNWTTQLDYITQAFQETFGSLSEEQMNWKSDEKTWSIAQNIDHLIVINESYFPILESLREGNYNPPFFAKFSFIPNFLGKTLLKAVQPDRKRKTKTFSMWEPTKGTDLKDILKKFEVHQERLKAEIENSEGLLTQGAIISSPANKNIVLKLDVAFDVIVTHEKRHFEQAKEVLVEHGEW